MDDILGIGKVLPLDKLIDTISGAVGRISKSYFDRKDIDTKVYEIKMLAEAKAEEMKIISAAIRENYQETGSIEYKENNIVILSPKELPIETNNQRVLINPTLEDRTKERVSFQEGKKQLNMESVIAYAAEELKNEPPVTDEPIDEDWATRFFRTVEDISNEEMQALWGKILAGEIKKPKSYSLRTLELIRNLSKNEADIFMKVANFAINDGKLHFLFRGEDETILEKYAISYGDIALLTEIGLLQTGTFVNYQLIQTDSDSQHALTSGNILTIIKVRANTPTIKIPVRAFIDK